MSDAVLRVNERFYWAFARGDIDAMDALWAHSARVACTHPGWRALYGRAAVMGSWRLILGHGPSPIRCEDVTLLSVEPALAVVVCVERIGEAELSATNVFALERDAWRIVHHHAGPVASRASASRVLN